MSPPRAPSSARRLGIGEWYGHVFAGLSPDERVHLAELQALRVAARPAQPCPFQSTLDKTVACTKAGGVCSMQSYLMLPDERIVVDEDTTSGGLRAVCPYRFREQGLVPQWVGNTLLGTHEPAVITEVGFLASVTSDREGSRPDVGRIDQVLLRPQTQPLQWCALEVQAVYMTGRSIQSDFAAIRSHHADTLPFPQVHHRLDYRSSGPKRLMPQLQIKVPTLRRWGKKMAVVVDRGFFDALAPMQPVDDVSNCDIAWFVVDFPVDPFGKAAHLTPHMIHLTTLEHAVEGLTAGIAVSREEFERRVMAKYERQVTSGA